MTTANARPQASDMQTDLLDPLIRLQESFARSEDYPGLAARATPIILRGLGPATEADTVLQLFDKLLDRSLVPTQCAHAVTLIELRSRGAIDRIDPYRRSYGFHGGCPWGAAICTMASDDPSRLAACREVLEDASAIWSTCDHLQRAARLIEQYAPRVDLKGPPPVPYAPDPVTSQLLEQLGGDQSPDPEEQASQLPFRDDPERAEALLDAAGGSIEKAFRRCLDDIQLARVNADPAAYLGCCHDTGILLSYWALLAQAEDRLTNWSDSIVVYRHGGVNGVLLQAGLAMEEWESSIAEPAGWRNRVAQILYNLEAGSEVDGVRNDFNPGAERAFRGALTNLIEPMEEIDSTITLNMLEFASNNGAFVADAILAEAHHRKALEIRRRSKILLGASRRRFIEAAACAAKLGHVKALIDLAGLAIDGIETGIKDDQFAELLSAAAEDGSEDALSYYCFFCDRLASKEPDPRICQHLVNEASDGYEIVFGRFAMRASARYDDASSRARWGELGRLYLDGRGTPDPLLLSHRDRRMIANALLLKAASYKEPYTPKLPFDLPSYNGLYDDGGAWDETALKAVLKLAEIYRTSGSSEADALADDLVVFANGHRKEGNDLLGAADYAKLDLARQRRGNEDDDTTSENAVADRLRMLDGLSRAEVDVHEVFISTIEGTSEGLVQDVLGKNKVDAIDEALRSAFSRQPHAAVRLAYRLAQRLCFAPQGSAQANSLTNRILEIGTYLIEVNYRLEPYERQMLQSRDILRRISGYGSKMQPLDAEPVADPRTRLFRRRLEIVLPKSTVADVIASYVLKKHASLEKDGSFSIRQRAYTSIQARSDDVRDAVKRRITGIAAALEEVDPRCSATELETQVANYLERPDGLRQMIAESTRHCGPVLTELNERGIPLPHTLAHSGWGELGWVSIESLLFTKRGNRVSLRIEGATASGGVPPLVTREDVLCCLAAVLIDCKEEKDGRLARHGTTLSLEPIHDIEGPPVPFVSKEYDPVWIGGAFGPTMYYCDKLLFINNHARPLSSFHDPFKTSRDESGWQPPQPWLAADRSGGIYVGNQGRAYVTVRRPEPKPTEEVGRSSLRVFVVPGRREVEGGDIVRDPATGLESRRIGELCPRFHYARYAGIMTERFNEIENAFPEYRRQGLLYDVMYAIWDSSNELETYRNTSLYKELHKSRRKAAFRMWNYIRKGKDGPLVILE